jgi:excisionase family DNA binding protein
MIEQNRKNESPAGEKGEKATTAATPFAKRYYRVDEVAHYFSVSDRTIYRLIDTGDIKAIRLRDCIRVSAEEIREFEKRVIVDEY